jgi:hypothetical protein
MMMTTIMLMKAVMSMQAKVWVGGVLGFLVFLAFSLLSLPMRAKQGAKGVHLR